MRLNIAKLVQATGLISTEEYKAYWNEHLSDRATILWEGVGYGCASLIQMFFAEVELGLPILSMKPVRVTVIECGKQQEAWYRIDGDGNLTLNVGIAKCSMRCKGFNKCQERLLSEVTIP